MIDFEAIKERARDRARYTECYTDTREQVEEDAEALIAEVKHLQDENEQLQQANNDLVECLGMATI